MLVHNWSDAWVRIIQYLPQCAATATRKKFAYTLPTQCWRQQTSTASITATKVLGSKRAIKKFVPFIPVSEKKRLHNKIDPSLQEYLEWLNTNWEEYSAEEHHQPSSSSSWSQTSWKRDSKNCTRLKLNLKREIWKSDDKILLFKRSIKNLNLTDFNYIKQIDGQIRLSEIKSACMENWN